MVGVCHGYVMTMAPEHHDWTRHGAGRCLLWWPLSSFVFIAVFPDAGIRPIVLSGAGLAVLGLAGAPAARAVRGWIRAATAGAPATSMAHPGSPDNRRDGSHSTVGRLPVPSVADHGTITSLDRATHARASHSRRTPAV